jgi:hypothetical protein
MFFRREKPKVDTFNERIEKLKPYGIAVQNESGRVKASRNGIAAMITDAAGDRPHIDKAGLMVGNEIGELVNGGYQQYWLTPSKKKVPAQAVQLKELHEFEEDLKEALGLSSLYNTSLGTVSALHLYDRVEERDDTVPPPKPWQVRQPVE